MTAPGSQASYNEVPYEGGIVYGSHPEHLAAIGRLFGIEAAPAEDCRVLEIGCAGAGNLLPMAYSLPSSRFLGIDPAERQIELGKQALAEYDIQNADLQALDVRDLSSWDETFDYIICHGVFSWVPDEIREAILDVCRRLLAPAGIAFVSYNVLPGFHVRAPIREMMQFHTRALPPAELGSQARALLDFLTKSTNPFRATDPHLGRYHEMLREESSLLSSLPDSYILHEHLEENNRAFYFHEFYELAAAHGLQYLGDASFHTMLLNDLPAEVAQSIHEVAANQVALEQYRDFVVNRMFRKSLLVRDDAVLERHISVEAIQRLSFRERIERESGAPWRISKVGDLEVEVSDPTVSAVLDALEGSAPQSLDFDEILSQLGESPESKRELLASILLSLHALDAVEFRTWSPPMGTRITEFPAAFLPARRSAAKFKGPLPLPLHGFVKLEPFAHAMLPFVDGSRDRTALAEVMRAQLADGSFVLPDREGESQPLNEENLHQQVDAALEELRRCGMLLP